MVVDTPRQKLRDVDLQGPRRRPCAPRMDRVQRLLLLLSRLQAGEECEVQLLAAELGISRRTLFRDLNLLRSMGVPLSHDRMESSYRLEKGYFFAPPALSGREAWSLMLLARMAMAGNSHPDPTALARAATKVMASLTVGVQDSCRRDLEYIEYYPHPSTDGARVHSLIRTLARARTACEQVQLSYDDDNGHRREIEFRPLAVAFVQTEWFVAGIVLKPQASTLLKLDRITTIQRTGKHFSAPRAFNLKGFLGRAWKHQPERRIYHVVLDCDPVASEEVESICWHESQRTTRTADGRVCFEADVDGLDEITRWILGFAGSVIVRDPPELIRRVSLAARRILSGCPSQQPTSQIALRPIQASAGAIS